MPAALPLDELQAELDRLGDETTRAWWSRYLKGEADFRGVATPRIRAASMAWWQRHDGDSLDGKAQLEVCLELLRCRMTEDKLAAMLLLGERLIPAGRVDHALALPRFAGLYAMADLADWNAVDWFCVRVLGPLIEAEGTGCAQAVAAWVDADVLWQRRSALVAFVSLARRGEYAELISETAGRLVRDQARFAQTAVAWVMRELGLACPELTQAFLERHGSDMSPEARTQAVGRRR